MFTKIFARLGRAGTRCALVGGLMFATVGSADALGRRSKVTATRVTTTAQTTVTTAVTTTAQTKAEHQARLGRCGHFSAVPAGHYEGVGMSSVSAADALSRCCYTGRLPVVQQAVAKGANGLWYAAKLFRPGVTCNGGSCK